MSWIILLHLITYLLHHYFHLHYAHVLHSYPIYYSLLWQRFYFLFKTLRILSYLLLLMAHCLFVYVHFLRSIRLTMKGNVPLTNIFITLHYHYHYLVLEALVIFYSCRILTNNLRLNISSYFSSSHFLIGNVCSLKISR